MAKAQSGRDVSVQKGPAKKVGGGKTNEEMKKLIVALCTISILVGCGTIQRKESVCLQVPPDSYSVICEMAARINTTPEAIGSVLKIANVGALSMDAYTAEQALNFLNDIELFIARWRVDGLTYTTLYNEVSRLFDLQKPEIQALFIILEEYEIDGLA